MRVCGVSEEVWTKSGAWGLESVSHPTLVGPFHCFQCFSRIGSRMCKTTPLSFFSFFLPFLINARLLCFFTVLSLRFYLPFLLHSTTTISNQLTCDHAYAFTFIHNSKLFFSYFNHLLFLNTIPSKPYFVLF